MVAVFVRRVLAILGEQVRRSLQPQIFPIIPVQKELSEGRLMPARSLGCAASEGSVSHSQVLARFRGAAWLVHHQEEHPTCGRVPAQSRCHGAAGCPSQRAAPARTLAEAGWLPKPPRELAAALLKLITRKRHRIYPNLRSAGVPGLRASRGSPAERLFPELVQSWAAKERFCGAGGVV